MSADELKIYRPGKAEDPNLCYLWEKRNEKYHCHEEFFRTYNTCKYALEAFADYGDGLDLNEWRLLVYRRIPLHEAIADNIWESDIEEMTENALESADTEIEGFLEEWVCKEAYEDFRKTIRPWLRRWMPEGYTFDASAPVGEVDLSEIKMEEWRSEDED